MSAEKLENQKLDETQENEAAGGWSINYPRGILYLENNELATLMQNGFQLQFAERANQHHLPGYRIINDDIDIIRIRNILGIENQPRDQLRRVRGY